MATGAGGGEAGGEGVLARRWLTAALGLWCLALGLGLLGVLLDADALRALGFPVRRAAVLVTVIWAVLAAIGALWRRVRRRR